MATPLPPQTEANDRLIASTPYEKLTQRQKDYAAKYHIGLMQPARPVSTTPVSQPVPPGMIRLPDGSIVPYLPEGTAGVATGPTAGTGAGAPPTYSSPPTGGMVTLPDGTQVPWLPGTTADTAAGGGGAAGSGSSKDDEDPEDKLAREARERSQRDAFIRLTNILEEYGLGSLAEAVKSWLQDGLSEAEITQRMRDTPEYKTRFAAMDERKKKGLKPISASEYVAYERQARQLMRAAGLPAGFYDGNDDFTRFLANDVSLSELGDRVGLASNAAFNSDQSVLSALAQFGVTGGDLTAFFLDPDRAQPLLERKYNAARLSAAGNRTGFGFLNEGEANDLLQAGVSESQAAQGFGDLAASQELFGSLDAGEDNISRGEQLGATFTGNANARRRIQQRQRRRQAAFEGSTNFAGNERGIVGLGSQDS